MWWKKSSHNEIRGGFERKMPCNEPKGAPDTHTHTRTTTPHPELATHTTHTTHTHHMQCECINSGDPLRISNGLQNAWKIIFKCAAREFSLAQRKQVLQGRKRGEREKKGKGKSRREGAAGEWKVLLVRGVTDSG